MIQVVTDSLANLPQSVMDEYRITMIPVYVAFGDEILYDQVDLTPTQFYQRLSQAEELPITSQPSVADFKALYQRLIEEQPGSTVLSLHITRSLSGTIESARQAAAALPGVDIRIFDTRSLSLGHGLMVREAARLAQAGASIDGIMARLEAMRDTMQVYLLLDTLDYLAKGGRIGRAARFMGTLLDMKPILTLQEGVVEAHSRHRTRPRAVAALRDLVLEGGRGRRDLQVGVMHAVCADDALYLAEQLRATLQPEVLLIGEIGPAVGVHTGPGALGVCWCYSPPQG